jgi:hypothetical protein
MTSWRQDSIEPKRLDFCTKGWILVDTKLIMKVIMEDTARNKKTKTTLYLSFDDEHLLDELFIKRIRDRKKTDRSSLLCEGIRLLYEKELGNSEEK